MRRKRDFAREYDLPERVLLASALDACRRRPSARRAGAAGDRGQGDGVATLEDMSDYHRQAMARSADESLRGRRVWCSPWPSSSRTVCCDRWPSRDGTSPPRSTAMRYCVVYACALLSPLTFAVALASNERLFDFHYRIEIYTPAPKRVYGYDVLPYLLGDEIVGVVDPQGRPLAGVLRVQGATLEAGWTPATSSSRCSWSCRRWRGGCSSTSSRRRIVAELAEELQRAVSPRRPRHHPRTANAAG